MRELVKTLAVEMSCREQLTTLADTSVALYVALYVVLYSVRRVRMAVYAGTITATS